MNVSEKLYFMRLLDEYPIAFTGRPPNLTFERAKIVVVARIVSNTTSMSEEVALNKMCQLRELSVDALPTFLEACRTLSVNIDFIQDFSKIQYLFEKNPQMSELNNLLSRI